MKTKVVDVIIPYYKKKKFITKTINSILNQSFKSHRIILIYDDKNLKDYFFLKKNYGSKIIILVNKKNLGAGISRNKGIKFSSSKYIAFCDADDIWKKNKLEKQINYMEVNNLDFIHSSYYIINEKNQINGIMPIKEKLSYYDLLKSCDIGLSTVVVKRSLLRKNLFKNLKTKEDYCLWLKLLRAGVNINGINKCLVYWRKNKVSLSSNTFQKLKDAFTLYNKYEKFSKALSLFFILRLSFNFILKRIKQKKNLNDNIL